MSDINMDINVQTGADLNIDIDFQQGETPEINIETAPPGPKGEKGDPGINGISATHRWDGTTLTVTSASGTSSADLKGEPGTSGVGIESIDQTVIGLGGGAVNEWEIRLTDGRKEKITLYNGGNGASGTDGYTPVKGKDYFDGKDGISPSASVKKTGDEITFAVQDANGTTSVSMPSNEKVLAVVDTIQADHTAVTAELQGIRVGYNQINYPNAGEAVRGQVSQLSRFTKAAVNLDSEMLNLSDAVFVSGSYVKSDGTIGKNGSLKYTEDYFSIAPDWESLTIYRKINLATTGAETLPSPCAVFYAENGAGATADSANTEHDGDYVTYKIPQWAKTVRFNFGATNPVDIVRINKFKNGKVGEFAGTFTELNQQLSTGIALRKGQKYLIRKENITDPFNAFVGGYSSNFVRMKKYERDMYFTPTAPGVLTLYNESVFGLLGEVKITVHIAGEESKLVEKHPKVYTVGKRSSEYDYTSFTQCLLDLKDDRSPKIIYINEGDYDIYQEYKDAGVPAYTGDSPTYDYFDYCVWIPENTHVIGRGVVRLMWMPDPNEVDLTYNDSAVVSPVNCAGTMTLENVEIHCKNGRYCIHDDPLGNDEFTNAIKKYINVRCYKYVNDPGFGFASTIGFGVDRSMRYEFHNCLFKNEGTGRAFYMHDRKKVGIYNLTEQMGSNLIVSNCVMHNNGTNCVKFGNSSSAAHIRVDFNSCWFSGKIDCVNESSTEATIYPNSWDLKLCLCNNVEINVADPDNLYPPLVYAH